MPFKNLSTSVGFIRNSSAIRTLSNFSRIEKIAFLAVVAGVSIRLFRLDSLPYGLDRDEASILYWAKRAFENQQFFAYSPEETHWEMFPGYLYWFVGNKLGWRVFPALLGIAEIAATGMLAGNLLGRTGGWIASAALAVTPWHVYYSRIIGTCTGVGLLAVLTGLSLRSLPRLASLMTAGLLYYTTFRLVVLRVFLQGLFESQFSAVRWAAFAAVSAALILVTSSDSPLRHFLTRGSYNLVSPGFYFLDHYLFSFLLPFAPLLSRFSEATDTFMVDHVHRGLWLSIGYQPALGFGVAILTLVGLTAPRPSNVVIRELLFLSLIILALGPLGPSYSRLLIAVPWLAIFAARGTQHLLASLGKGRAEAVLALCLALSLAGSATVLFHLPDEKLQTVFPSRHRHLLDLIETTPRDALKPIYLFSGPEYFTARFWGELGGIEVLPELPLEDLVQILRFDRRGRRQIIFFDAPETQEMRSLQLALGEATRVVRRDDIIREGRLIASRWEIQW